MAVTPGMEATAQRIQERKPKADVGFVCSTCEGVMIGNARTLAGWEDSRRDRIKEGVWN
jgi:hypothetical protein